MRGGPRSFPQGSTCPMVLWILPRCLGLRLRGSHPLRPAFPGPFRCPPQSLVQSEPQRARALVWALPVPLAATPGITVVFSSSGYLDVSVRRVPSSMPMCSAWGGGVFPRRVSPFRHLRIAGHLLLPAAFRSLSRLSSAPGAKASALCPSSLNRGTPCAVPLSRLAWRYRRVHPRHRCLASLDFRPAHAPACMAAPPPGGLPSGSSFWMYCCAFPGTDGHPCPSKVLVSSYISVFGFQGAIMLMGQNLSSFAIEPTSTMLFRNRFRLMGLSGLEPPTSRLSGVRSNQLSYKPTMEMEGIEPLTPCLQGRCSPS